MANAKPFEIRRHFSSWIVSVSHPAAICHLNSSPDFKKIVEVTDEDDNLIFVDYYYIRGPIDRKDFSKLIGSLIPKIKSGRPIRTKYE